MKFEQSAEIDTQEERPTVLYAKNLKPGVLYRQWQGSGPGAHVYFIEHVTTKGGGKSVIIDIGPKGLSLWDVDHNVMKNFVEAEEDTEVVIKLCGVKKQET
jgi:hypothetical protein